MSWTTAEIAAVTAKLHSWFGKWGPGEMEALLEEFRDIQPSQFIEAARTFWTAGDKKRKPWPKALREQMGPKQKTQLESGKCLICAGVASVPAQVLELRFNAIPQEAAETLTGPLVRKMQYRDALGDTIPIFWLDWRLEPEIPEAKPLTFNLWCDNCAPASVNPISKGAYARANLAGKIRIHPQYDFLEPWLKRIVEGVKIDPQYTHDDELRSPEQVAGDDAFWEERYAMARTPQQVEALRRYRSLMRKGVNPFSNPANIVTGDTP